MEEEEINFKKFKYLEEIKLKLNNLDEDFNNIEETIEDLKTTKVGLEIRNLDDNLLAGIGRKKNWSQKRILEELKEEREENYNEIIEKIIKEKTEEKEEKKKKKDYYEAIKTNFDLVNILKFDERYNQEKNIQEEQVKLIWKFTIKEIKEMYRMVGNSLMENIEQKTKIEEIKKNEIQPESAKWPRIVINAEKNKTLQLNVETMLMEMETIKSNHSSIIELMKEMMENYNEKFKNYEIEMTKRSNINQEIVECYIKAADKMREMEKDWKKYTKWKEKFEEENSINTLKQKKMENELDLLKVIIQRYEGYIKSDYERKEIETRVNNVERNVKWLQNLIIKKNKGKQENFQIEKESYKNENFFSYMSFLIINIRRINLAGIKDKNERTKKALDKLNWILQQIEKFNPLIVWINDIGEAFKKENMEIIIDNINYENYFTKDMQNLLMIHKCLDLKVKQIGENNLVIENKIICTYYKPKIHDKTFNFVLNNLNDVMIAGDINFNSHNKIKNKKKIIEKKEYIKFREGVLYECKKKYKMYYEDSVKNAICFINVKHKVKNYCKLIKPNKEITDHDGLFCIIKGSWKKNQYYDKQKWENRVLKKTYSNLYTKNLMIRISNNLEEGKNEIEKQKGYEELEVWKNKKKKMINNKIRIKKLIKENLEKKERRKKNINVIMEEINKKMEGIDEKKFRILRKLMHYSSREKFYGTYIKNEYIDEFIKIEKASETVRDKSNECREIIQKAIDDLKKLKIDKLWNKLSNSFSLYNKSYSQATDINDININIVDKFWKNYSLKKMFNEEYELNEKWKLKDYIIWCLNVVKELTWNKKMEFKTFYLDKNKNINSIDNFRIIAICPITVKLYEQMTYAFVDDYLEKVIRELTQETQFGFMRRKNCQMAIKYLKDNDINGMTIALDIYRAYEFVDLQKIKEYIEKIEMKNEKKMEKLNISFKFILLWIELIKKCNLNMNGRIIKQKTGVPMGSKFSPKLFDFYTAIMFEEIIKKYNKKDMILVQFADDVIIKIKWNKTIKIMSEIKSKYEEFNLKINEKKSEILIKKNINDYKYQEWTEILDFREKFKFNMVENLRYLGKWIKVNKNNEIETGKDLFKEIGKTIFFKNIEWSKKLELTHLFIISKRRYLLESENDINKIKQMIKEINSNIINLRLTKKNTYLETLTIMNYLKIIIRQDLGWKENIRENPFKYLYQFIYISNRISNWDKSKEMGLLLTNIEDECKRKYEEIPEEKDKDNKLDITQDNISMITGLSYYELNKICNQINNKILMSFLWNKELQKLDISNEIFKLNINNVLKDNFLGCIVFLIQLISNRSNDERMIEKKINIFCKDCWEIINDKEWLNKWKIDNEVIAENIRKYRKDNNFNFIKEIAKIPRIIGLEKKYINEEKLQNEKIEEVIENCKENILKNCAENNREDLKMNIEELRCIIKKIVKIKQKPKIEKLEDNWEKWINENKKKILTDINSNMEKYRKKIKNHNESILIMDNNYKTLEAIVRWENQFFDNIENNPIKIREKEKKEKERKNQLDPFYLEKEKTEEDIIREENEKLEEYIINREYLYLEYSNIRCNIGKIDKLIKCLNLQLNKISIKEWYKKRNEKEFIKTFFKEVKNNWDQWKKIKGEDIRERKKKEFYKRKYKGDWIRELARRDIETKIWKNALKSK